VSANFFYAQKLTRELTHACNAIMVKVGLHLSGDLNFFKGFYAANK
jgi:hypothetical protein